MEKCYLCGTEQQVLSETYWFQTCDTCHSRLTDLRDQSCSTCSYYNYSCGCCMYGDVCEHLGYQDFNYQGVEIHVPVHETDDYKELNHCTHYKILFSLECKSETPSLTSTSDIER